MARPYPAGGVSIAESNHHAVGPLLLPLAASRHSAGLPSPHVTGAILIASDSNHTGFRPRRGGAEERTGLRFSSLHSHISKWLKSASPDSLVRMSSRREYGIKLA